MKCILYLYLYLYLMQCSCGATLEDVCRYNIINGHISQNDVYTVCKAVYQINCIVDKALTEQSLGQISMLHAGKIHESQLCVRALIQQMRDIIKTLNDQEKWQTYLKRKHADDEELHCRQKLEVELSQNIKIIQSVWRKLGKEQCIEIRILYQDVLKLTKSGIEFSF